MKNKPHKPFHTSRLLRDRVLLLCNHALHSPLLPFPSRSRTYLTAYGDSPRPSCATTTWGGQEVPNFNFKFRPRN
eukprot:scaffold143894_cov27-Tisochrysis_lutea.AAC.1